MTRLLDAAGVCKSPRFTARNRRVEDPPYRSESSSWRAGS